MHAIATAQGIFVSAVVGDSPALYRLDPSGTVVWAFDSKVYITHAHWPLLAHGHVILNDDGLYILDPESGTKLYDRGLDSWGQLVADPSRLYLVNEWHVDGPRVLVGGFDPAGHAIWQQNVSGSVREDVKDVAGAIALESGTLFQAAEYRFVPFSGLFAFDAETGNQKWSVDLHPGSAISLGNGKLYLVERATREHPESLTARRQATGESVWSTPVQQLDSSPPVLVSNLVLTFSHNEGVSAWNESTGEPAWTRRIPGSGSESTPHATHIAAAAGSATLIVASGATLAILSQEDGRELWRSEEPEAGRSELHSPILAHGRVYLVGNDELRAYSCGAIDQ